MTPIERFLGKIDVTPTGCWVWTAGRAGGRGNRYGYFCAGQGRNVYAHRWSYEYFVGPIPVDLEVDHLCRNTLCVNPDHLEPVTPQENVDRRSAALTHCPTGHEYDAINTYHDPTGNKHCRTCKRERDRRRRHLKRTERLWPLK